MPAVKPPPGTLGGLSFFGYTTSTPFMLDEAYVNGTAHVHAPTPVPVPREQQNEFHEDEEAYEYDDKEDFWDEEGEGEGEGEGEDDVGEEDEMDVVKEGQGATDEMDVD